MARELELNVRPIFSTPLLVFSIPEADQINAELKRAVLAREASEPAYHDREVIGWSSPHDMSMMEWAGKMLDTVAAQMPPESRAALTEAFAMSKDLEKYYGREQAFGVRLGDQGVEGVLVIAPQISAVGAVAKVSTSVPVVAVGSGSRSRVPMVAVDNLTGATAATRHLLDLGHRTVHHVAGPAGWLESQDRLDGWRRTLEEAGAEMVGPAGTVEAMRQVTRARSPRLRQGWPLRWRSAGRAFPCRPAPAPCRSRP